MRGIAEKKKGFFTIDYVIHILMFEIKEEFVSHYYFRHVFFPLSVFVRNLVFLLVEKKNTDSYFLNLLKKKVLIIHGIVIFL